MTSLDDDRLSDTVIDIDDVAAIMAMIRNELHDLECTSDEQRHCRDRASLLARAAETLAKRASTAIEAVQSTRRHSAPLTRIRAG